MTFKKMAEHGAGADESKHNTVFIDTNLDTRLVTIVSDSDTVYDLKRKIVLDHHRCFPAIGDINVRCLKVKRRGNFYHLTDSMLVKSAFGARKKDWFVTVEASRPEQDGDIRHMDRCEAGDQLALPWVTNSQSVDRHDNHADRTSNVPLDCGSPSMHPIIAPFVNLKVPSTDKFTSGDSCKDVSKNIGEDRSTNDDGWKNPKPGSEKQLDTNVQEEFLTVNKAKSKKRTRDVQNKSLLEDAAGSGPFVKKRCKTQRLEGNVKASEEDIVSKSGTGKLKHKAVSLIDESLYEPNLESKDLGDENTRGESSSASDQVATIVPSIVEDESLYEPNLESKDLGDENTRGENNSAPDQVATIVPSIVEDVQEDTHSRKNTEASETVPEVAMAVEKNIRQEMPFGISQMEKDTELVQQAAVDNEIPSSMITGTGHSKAAECSTKPKAAEKEVSSTSFSKEFHNINKDAMDSSHKDVGSTGQDAAVDEIDKRKKERGEGKKRKSKKSAVKSKDESLVKHADNFVGDISSTVPAGVFDEKSIDAPAVTATGHSKAAECSTKPKAAEKGVSSTSFSKELHNINKDAMDSSHKDVGPTRQESAVEEIDKHKKERGESKKRKSKKSTVKSKDELLVKHADNFVGDISSTVPAQVFDEKNIDERKNDKDTFSSAERNEVSEKTLIDDSFGYATKTGDDNFVKEVEILEPTESMEERLKKQSKDTGGGRKTIEDVGRVSLRIDESIVKHTSDAATVTNKEKLSPRSERKESVKMAYIDALPVDHGRNVDVMTNNDVEVSRTENIASQVNAKGVNDNSEKQNEKMDAETKKNKTKKKAKKSAGRSDNVAVVANEAKLLPQTEGNENIEMTSLDALHIDHVRNDNILMSNDVATVTNEEKLSPRSGRKESVEMEYIDALPVDHGRNDGIMMNNDVEVPRTENNASQVNAKGVVDNPEKQNEKMDAGTKKNKTKKKAKKSAGRSDSVAVVANEEKLLPQTEGNENMEMTSIDALHIDHVRNDNILMSNDVELSRTEKNVSQVNAGGINDDLEKQTEKRDDGTKKSKKTKAKKSTGRSEDTAIVTTEEKLLPSSDIPKDNSHAIDFRHYFVPHHQPENSAPTDIGEDGKDAKLPGREKKRKKKIEGPSFVETSYDLQQSLVLRDNKQNREHGDFRNDSAIQARKSLSRKENNKALLSSKKTSEVFNDVVKDQNTRNIDEVKTPKGTIKIDAIRAPNTKTSEVSNGLVKDQNTGNTDEVKTPKWTKKIDAIRATKTAQASKGSSGPSPVLSSMSESFGRSFPDKKSNQQQSTLGHSHLNTFKESAPAVKGLLHTPGAIFGDDSDESSADDNATVDSDSSTRTPSRRSSSSEESDSASSIDTRKNVVKRKDAYRKSTMNSRSSEMKSMSDLLRSSSRFKKARLSASQPVDDTESQPVDFVPESQL